MIKIKGLSKAFNKQVILDNVDLDVAPGEIVVILGESGVGKSVLLKHIIGLLRPDSGSIKIDSQEITTLKESQMLKIRRTVGYLFQEGALYDFMTVFDNIAFPLREHTALNTKEIRAKVSNILQLLSLEGVESKLPSELSGGMKKRVALARSIILDSKVLLCDEPTSGLDPIRSRQISDLIKSVSKKIGCTTIITSHDIKNSFRIADRVAIIKEAKIIALGSESELKSSTIPFVQEFIK